MSSSSEPTVEQMIDALVAAECGMSLVYKPQSRLWYFELWRRSRDGVEDEIGVGTHIPNWRTALRFVYERVMAQEQAGGQG